jgi:hypothetical protein
MPIDMPLWARIRARIRALWSQDWIGSAGERFRETTHAINEFAKESSVRRNEIFEAGVELGWRNLQGVATVEYAHAVEEFAAAENAKIEAELHRRSVESRVRKEIAEAQKSEAEASIARIREAEARIALFKKLNELGVALEFRSDGTMVVQKKPDSCDFNELLSEEGGATDK